MTVEQLATQLEIDYWANNATRVACGEEVSQDEAFAARVHLPVLCRHTARAAARWSRRSHRPGRYQPPYVADTVAGMAEDAVRADPTCGSLIGAIGWLLLRQLLQNLAWRFAVWLLSDSTHEDRPDLLCRMEAE